MIFHNQQDDEHWEVKPERFDLDRSKDSPFEYKYSIQLLVVGAANPRSFEFKEDKGWMDAVKDTLRAVQSGINMVTGALNDLTALSAELTNLVKNFATILDSVSTAIDAAGNFVNGASNLIQSPITILDSAIGVIDAAGRARATLEASVADIRSLPSTVNQKFRQMEEGLEMIVTQPQAFETPSRKVIQDIKRRQELLLSAGSDAIDTAEATAPPASLNDVDAQGTEITAGDVTSAAADFGIGRIAEAYTSTFEYKVGQGDTLASISAKFLNDARSWQDIAVVNGLKPPFVDDLATVPIFGTDEDALPNSLGVGSTILIPSFAPPPVEEDELPILGVRAERPVEEHLLGSDLKLEMDPNSRLGAPVFDIPIDSDRGSVDVQIVSGLDNISQALITRLRTERGQDVMYQSVGVRRIIGVSATDRSLETTQFRLAEAVLSDPRVRNVESIELEVNQDLLQVEMDVSLKGLSQNTNIKTITTGAV
jgi:hypothetical protein